MKSLTVAELIDELAKLPQHLEVVANVPGTVDFCTIEGVSGPTPDKDPDRAQRAVLLKPGEWI